MRTLSRIRQAGSASRRSASLCFAMVALAIGASAFAAPGDLIGRVDNPTPARGDHFGIAVDNAADVFLVGSSGDDQAAQNAGIAFAVNPSTISVTAQSPNPVHERNAFFGDSVAAEYPRYAYGAPGAGHDGQGAVYLYGSSTPIRIDDPTPAARDEFGRSVAFSGGVLAVGAPRDDQGASDAGVVHLFDAALTTTTTTYGAFLLTIANPTPEAHDFFGSSLAGVEGGYLLIGAKGDETGAHNAGSAYLYDVDPASGAFGQLILTINNPTPQADDQFGFSVAVVGGNLAVGAYRDRADGDHSTGTAYLFDGLQSGVTNTPIATIPNPNPKSSIQFGYALAGLRNSYIVIGANRGRHGGTVYIYDAKATGTVSAPLVTIENPQPEAKDGFGSSVGTMPGGTIIVGAPAHDVAAHYGRVRDAGSVFLFEGIAPGPITTTSVLFEVDSALSDFSVNVDAGGMSMNFEPLIFGTLGADVMMQEGEIVGIHVKEFDMGGDDISSDVPFQFDLVGLGTVMGNGRGAAGPPAPVGPDGSFDQQGNSVQFDGQATVYVPQAGERFSQSGGPTAGDLPLDFRGYVVETPDGLELQVPCMIQRTVKWGDGPFEPVITATGMMVAHEQAP